MRLGGGGGGGGGCSHGVEEEGVRLILLPRTMLWLLFPTPGVVADEGGVESLLLTVDEVSRCVIAYIGKKQGPPFDSENCVFVHFSEQIFWFNTSSQVGWWSG